jgi:hypothetical protein
MQGEGKHEEFQSSMWLWEMELYAYSIYSTGIVSLTSSTDVTNQLPLLHEDYIEKECLSSNASQLCLGGVKPEHWLC